MGIILIPLVKREDTVVRNKQVYTQTQTKKKQEFFVQSRRSLRKKKTLGILILIVNDLPCRVT
jgi:hypothetical protein